MEVILLERIKKIGQMGDIVTVKTGFARNYLLPQKKALRSTKENLAYFEAQRVELEARNLKNRQEAEKIAVSIKGLSVALVRQASEAGQLYGSVTARDIHDAIRTMGIKLERRQVELPQPLKNIGIYDVSIVLHPDVTEKVKVTIARSQEESLQLEKIEGSAVNQTAEVPHAEKVEETEVPSTSKGKEV